MRSWLSRNDGAAAGIAAVVGGLSAFVLAGWLFDILWLRAFGATWSPMAPLTAVLLLLLAAGILLFERRRILANVLITAAFVCAAGVLIEYLFDARLGLSYLTGLLYAGRAPLPEQPAPDAAAAMMMIGIALACLRTSRSRLHDFADVVAAVIAIICLQVLIAYAYNVTHAGGFIGFRQIAPHSAIAALLLALAAVARRPTFGLFAALRGSEQSALLLRRLLPITLFLCVLVGWLQLLAVRARVGGTLPELVSWSVTMIAVVLALLLFVTSAEMRKAEATVRRRQEELLAATAEAQAASEAKSRFMAVMSHELRTPLTAVIGYAGLLDVGMAGELSKEARLFTQRIRESGWQLVSMIDAVLFYAGGQPPAADGFTTRIELGEQVREAAHMFAAQARGKALDFEVLSPDAPLFVDTNLESLRAILINLMSNAVKFTDAGAITIAVQAHGGRAVVSVTDTGIGISSKNLSRIWEPFQQADATHTRQHGGMGLGLALTRRLAEQLNARLYVQSVVGTGTTFTLELPAVQTAESTERLSAARILVVDDETTVRRIMARTFARYGAQVSEAASAAEARAAIDGNPPFDVLVTDISMPNETGIELAQGLHAAGYAVPILFVTGAELDERDHAKIAALGGNLLRKPFDMAELARFAARLIGVRP